jgi:hypothetical protein
MLARLEESIGKSGDTVKPSPPEQRCPEGVVYSVSGLAGMGRVADDKDFLIFSGELPHGGSGAAPGSVVEPVSPETALRPGAAVAEMDRSAGAGVVQNGDEALEAWEEPVVVDTKLPKAVASCPLRREPISTVIMPTPPRARAS